MLGSFVLIAIARASVKRWMLPHLVLWMRWSNLGARGNSTVVWARYRG
ncbi:MAG: hypothetical protein ACI9W2_003331 [Gammaproteobacteria bacterium]